MKKIVFLRFLALSVFLYSCGSVIPNFSQAKGCQDEGFQDASGNIGEEIQCFTFLPDGIFEIAYEDRKLGACQLAGFPKILEGDNGQLYCARGAGRVPYEQRKERACIESGYAGYKGQLYEQGSCFYYTETNTLMLVPFYSR